MWGKVLISHFGKMGGSLKNDLGGEQFEKCNITPDYN